MVPNDDRHALAGAMWEMLAKSKRAKGFGQAGRQRVARRFTVDRMVEAYARLYDEVS
jgi:glycosyltransferase involved in cell wall biosynthesis